MSSKRTKSKHSPIETKNIIALDYYDNDLLIENFDDTYDDDIYSLDAEKLINFLSTEETEVLLLRYIGYKAEEIVSILDLKDIYAYYAINSSTKIHSDLFELLHKY